MTMVHKNKRERDFREALEGEGWAIVDYTDMIVNAKNSEERRVLTHIRDDEKEHQTELLKLMRCR